jgi:hypothetical protein
MGIRYKNEIYFIEPSVAHREIYRVQLSQKRGRKQLCCGGKGEIHEQVILKSGWS